MEIHNNKKDISFEIMRTIACFFVVVNHVFDNCFLSFGKISYHNWLFATSVRSFAFFAVPLFVMISGALLLGKDISIDKTLRKAFKFLLILLLWSTIYILVSNIYLNKQTFSALQIINMFLNNKVKYHLWYLYMLIGIYIILPLINKLINNGLKLQKFYIIMFLSYSSIILIPTLLSTLLNIDIHVYTAVPLMDWQLGCLFIGYYINNLKITKRKFFISIIGFIILNIFTIILTCVQSLKIKSPSESYCGNMCINIILEAVFVFTIIKYISKYISKNSLLGKFFYFIGSISLEIYLVHPLIIDFYYAEKIPEHLMQYIPKSSLRYLLELIFVFFLSIVIAYLIKIIKYQVKYFTRKLFRKSSITA